MRREDVKSLLVSLLPTGSESLYALQNTDNIGGIIWALAGALKDTATDRVEALRREVNPSTIVEKIPDWEAALGLSTTPAALFGTTEQRRNAILAALREHGSLSIPDLRAALQPYLLYADASQIVVVEADRTALTLLNTRANTTALTLGASSTGTRSIRIADDPTVSQAGAMIGFSITGNLAEVSLRLSSPGLAVSQDWPPGFFGTGAVVAAARTARSLVFAGNPALRGDWTLRLTTGPGGGATLHSWAILVEGEGVNLVGPPPFPPIRNGEGLGSGMFEFLVLVDPALLGAGYDLDGARRLVQKIKPAHALGNVGLVGALGDGCAIPDDPASIPNRCLPCS